MEKHFDSGMNGASQSSFFELAFFDYYFLGKHYKVIRVSKKKKSKCCPQRANVLKMCK
jgi:hypothetical protein